MMQPRLTKITKSEQPVSQPARPRRSRRRKVLIGLLGGIGGIVVLIVGFYAYLMIAEWLDPSGRVSVTIDDQRVWLEQSFTVVTPRPDPDPDRPMPVELTPTPTPKSSPAPTPLPPLEIQIPDIDVGVPVVLVDNDNLPRVPIAGWFFKSAFPATKGNTVIVGHLDGPAAVFGRLSELASGDEVHILTQADTHVYVVDTTQIVDAKAVEWLAPTEESVVTLITCAGDWNPQTQSYDKRLVVRGHYAAIRPGTGTASR